MMFTKVVIGVVLSWLIFSPILVNIMPLKKEGK